LRGHDARFWHARLHDGERVLLRAPGARLSWPKKGAPELSLAGEHGISASRHDGVLAVSAERDLSEALESDGALAAEACSDRELAAIIVDSDEAVLVSGRVPEPGQPWARRLGLSGLEGRVPSWADVLDLAPGGEREESDARSIPPDQDKPPALGANGFGAAVASSSSGLVCLVRLRAPLEPKLVFRLALDSADCIYALPTELRRS
jgi:hypothetical protein